MIYEFVMSIFMLTIGICGAIYTNTFRKQNAKYMPLFAFGVMIIFSLVVLVTTIIKYRKNRGQVSPKQAVIKADSSNTWISTHASLVTFLKLLILLLFFISFKWINFFITMPLVVLAIGLLSEINWKKVVPTAVVSTAVTYGVFILWLNIYMG